LAGGAVQVSQLEGQQRSGQIGTTPADRAAVLERENAELKEQVAELKTQLSNVQAGKRAVITKVSQREILVGQFVRIEGVVSNTLMPQLVGVDIEMPSEPIAGSVARKVIDLRDKSAWAEGVLVRNVVRPEEIRPGTQNRGAGVFYRLLDPQTSKTAVVHPAGTESPK